MMDKKKQQQLDKIIKAFDSLLAKVKVENTAPSVTSIKKINEKLSVKLPESLLYFANHSQSFSYWFAGLGENYHASHHIININKYCKAIRRRVIAGKGKWENVFPRQFIAINCGYDNDFICFDLSGYDSLTGEYPIIYWSPPRIVGELSYPSFIDYITDQITHWANNKQREIIFKLLKED